MIIPSVHLREIVSDSLLLDFQAILIALQSCFRQAAYVIGYACNMSVETDEHAASTGINEVNANTRQSNGKTYNVLGQQVSAGAKGLLIRDGKKYIAK